MPAAPRPHRRTIAHWLVAVPLGVGLALAVALLLGWWDGNGNGDRAGGSTTTAPAGAGVPTFAPTGTTSQHALWLFGFDTLRVDPSGRDGTTRIDRPAFGSVAGGDGAVFMYDPAQASAGRLDTRTGRIATARVGERRSAARQDETVATAGGDGAWIVSAPGTVTRLDAHLQVTATAVIDPGAADTWVTGTDDGGAVVAVVSATRVDLARLAPDGSRTASGTVASEDPGGPPVGVATDGGTLWVVRERGAQPVDARTLAPAETRALPAGAGAVLAHAAGDGLWVVADQGRTAYRVAAEAEPAAVPLPDTRAAGDRGQLAVTVGLDAVWVLVPTGSEAGDRSAAVLRIDPLARKVTETLSLPSSLFVGGLAVS